MLKYHAIRIESTYIPKLKRNFRKCPVILVSPEDTHMGSSLAKIENLRRLVFSISDLDLSHLDNLSRFVLDANQVRTSNYAKAILVDSQLATNETRKLWESIYFLSRLRSAFERMTRVLLTFQVSRRLDSSLFRKQISQHNHSIILLVLRKHFDF